MYRISRLRAVGFRGFKREVDIHVPRGFLVVTGRNGSGKSSFCEAIEFALTGKIGIEEGASEAGERRSDYTWWRGHGPSSDRFVELTLAPDTGDTLLIRREPGTEQSELTKELESQLCGADSPPTNSLEEFCRTAILRGETLKSLSIEMPESDRFGRLRVAAGNVDLSSFARIATEWTDAVRTHFEGARARYESARQRMADLAQVAGLTSTGVSDSQDTVVVERLQRALDTRAVDLGDLMAQVRQALALRFARLSDCRRLASRVAAAAERIAAAQSLGAATSQAENQRHAAEASARLAVLQVEIENASLSLKQRLEGSSRPSKLEGLVELGREIGLEDGRCPLCGSEVEGGAFADHLTSVLLRLAETDTELQQLRAQRRRLELAAAEAEEEAKRTSAAASVWLVERRAAELELKELCREAEASGFAESVTENTVLAAVESWASAAHAEAVALQELAAAGEASLNRRSASRMQVELEGAKEDLNDSERSIRKWGSELEKVKGVLGIVKRLTGEVTDERLAAMFPVVTEFYERLRPHPDWPAIGYRTRGEVRRFLGFQVGDGENPRFMFSDGQRRALGLAFLLALHATTRWSLVHTLVVDDAIQHIDDYRALQLVESLAALRMTGEQLIVTSESDALAQFLARRLRATETEPGGRLLLEYESGEGVKATQLSSSPWLPTAILRAS